MDWSTILGTAGSAASTYFTGGLAGGGGMMGGDEKKGGAASAATSGDITAGPVSVGFGDFNLGAYKSGAGSASSMPPGIPSWLLPVVATVAVGAIALVLRKR